MRRSMRWLGLPLVVVLAACPRDTTQDDVVITDDPAAPAPETAPPQVGQPGMAAQQTATVQEVQGSGVSGNVNVTERGNQTHVEVQLSGAPANTSLPGHVHSGTCDNIGGVVQPLEAIQTDGMGNGTASSTVDVAPATAMDGQHIVVYHGQGGTPIACASIPGRMM